MVTVFRLPEQAIPSVIAFQLSRSRTSLDDPNRFAIVDTKDGKVVLAGAGAPRASGAVDVVASAPGSNAQQRVIGDVLQTAKANLFSWVGKASIVASSACGAGATCALLSGNWWLGLALVTGAAWTAAPAMGEYIRQVSVGVDARRSLKRSGVDLEQVHPEPESSFSEVLARSAVPY